MAKPHSKILAVPEPDAAFDRLFVDMPILGLRDLFDISLLFSPLGPCFSHSLFNGRCRILFPGVLSFPDHERVGACSQSTTITGRGLRNIRSRWNRSETSGGSP